MIKRTTLVLAVLTGLTLLVYAQPRVTVYASAGLSVPAFPATIKDYYQPGIHLSGGLGVPLSRRTEFTVTGLFSRYRLDEEALIAEFEAFEVLDVAFEGGGYSWYGLTANLKYAIYPQSRIGPYALFGAGLFNSTADALRVIESDGVTTRAGSDEVGFGLNAGIGFYVPVAPALRIVLEPRYTLLFTDTRLLFSTDRTRHFIHFRAGLALNPF